MTIPYVIFSDQHCHAWSMFATTDADGVNSRLRAILNEMERGADELIAAGGRLMVFAGDLFHERGTIDTDVVNPVQDCIRRIINKGVTIVAIPGNHDLKGKDTTELGSAVKNFGAIVNFHVIHHRHLAKHSPHEVIMVPWRESNDQLRADLKEMADLHLDRHRLDVVIHAGIDGVLIRVPNHGLTAAELAAYGFRRVFAGHYHDHKVMEGGKVISIGATTHQTMSDIGTTAGFLMVYPDRIEHRATRAPLFVEITADTADEDIFSIVDGNYVRVRGRSLAPSDVAKMRAELIKLGAKGVVIDVLPEEILARSTTPRAASVSIEASVDKYIDGMSVPDAAAVKIAAAAVLSAVQSVSV